MEKQKQVPDEWMIGRRSYKTYNPDRTVKSSEIQKLCYLTFTENGKINSEVSWKSWRDKDLEIITFKNEFIEGWKIIDTFNQRSGYNSSRKLFVIEEPRFGYQFELDVAPMTMLLQNIEVNNGVIKGKFALSRTRTLINEKDYNVAVDSKPIKTVTEKTIQFGDVIIMGGANKKTGKYSEYIYVGKKLFFDKKWQMSDPMKITSMYIFAIVGEDGYEILLDGFSRKKIRQIPQEEYKEKFETKIHNMKKATDIRQYFYSYFKDVELFNVDDDLNIKFKIEPVVDNKRMPTWFYDNIILMDSETSDLYFTTKDRSGYTHSTCVTLNKFIFSNNEFEVIDKKVIEDKWCFENLKYVDGLRLVKDI